MQPQRTSPHSAVRAFDRALPAHGRRSGFTLIELSISMVVMLVAVSILSSTVANLAQQRSINRENTIATNAGRVIIERMRGAEFEDVFALYNADPSDDPSTAAGAPGHRFAVDGLDRLLGAPDNLIGEVFFPSMNLAAAGDPPALELRENLVDAELGMPRDLNGDSIIDAFDHTGDYVILPLIVRMRWQGRSGPREYSTATIICRFER